MGRGRGKRFEPTATQHNASHFSGCGHSGDGKAVRRMEEREARGRGFSGKLLWRTERVHSEAIEAESMSLSARAVNRDSPGFFNITPVLRLCFCRIIGLAENQSRITYLRETLTLPRTFASQLYRTDLTHTVT